MDFEHTSHRMEIRYPPVERNSIETIKPHVLSRCCNNNTLTRIRSARSISQYMRSHKIILMYRVVPCRRCKVCQTWQYVPTYVCCSMHDILITAYMAPKDWGSFLCHHSAETTLFWILLCISIVTMYHFIHTWEAWVHKMNTFISHEQSLNI